MTDHPSIPPAILTRLNAICLGLPEAYEVPAWTSTRWMVGKGNFAHVVVIAKDWPPAYTEAAGTMGPVTTLTFRPTDCTLGGAEVFEAVILRLYRRPEWVHNADHLHGLLFFENTCNRPRALTKFPIELGSA